MKKLLLATAAFALIAPAAQAEIKLDLGGYFKGYAGYSDQDASGVKKFDLKRKSQVSFTGETTLDNGLTVGYNGTLFQENNNGSRSGTPVTGDYAAELERSYLYFSGNWGRVNLGRENGAAYLLQVSAPGADANIDGQDAAFSFYNAATAAGATTVRQDYKHISTDQYSDKITYLTPKFNGFQAGVTYAPTVVHKTTTDRFGMPAKASYDHKDLMEVGARYDGEFSGVGVHAGAGYNRADAANAANEDFDAWNAGLKFTVDAFGFGAAYLDEDAGVAYDARTWVAGVDYTYGAYTFGGSYFNTKNKSVDADLDRWTVGAGYTFGPGMKFNGTVGYYNGDNVLGAGLDNDATVVTIGTDIQF